VLWNRGAFFFWAWLYNAASGRIAQRESARFTRGRSLVRSQVRPPRKALETGPFCCVSGNGMAICKRPCKRDLGEFDGITTLANGTC
jgi:hypothetical protein